MTEVPPAASPSASSPGGQGSWQPRVMVMFCDLVGSTELSGRHDPERYGLLVRRYVAEVRTTVCDRFGGRLVNEEGDGLLVLFGAPHAHGDDAERAVRAAVALVERIRELSAETERTMGEALAVRVAVHRGQVYWAADDSVYGLAVNLAARLQTLAGPGEVVISDEVQRMVGPLFETEPGEPQPLKGVGAPVRAHRVVGERVDRPRRRAARTPLVDRTAEMGRLRRAWRARRGGASERSAPVLLRGDAGLGKSRLASELADLAAADGATVVELAGSAFSEDAGLYPVRRLLERTLGVGRETGGAERLARLRRDLGRRRLDEETMLPLLATVLGLEPATGYVAPPLEARRLNVEVLEAAHRYLGSCLGDGPCVLIAEDVHWFDRSTLDLLARQATGPSRCVVVMTGRPGVVPFEGIDVVDLHPLSEDDSGRLVDARCADAEVGAAVRAEVVARSDGVPLYIEELVANVRQGVPALADGAADRSSGAVPDLLYDLLAARLDSPASTVGVAAASAVIGRDIERPLLQRVLDPPPPDLDRALDLLCAQEVLERRPGREQYRFRHELLREVAYELQPPSRRRHLHGRLADALTSDGAADAVVDWGLTATHYERAGRAAEAAGAYEAAAAAARLRGAFAEARGALDRALELLVAGVERDPERDVTEVRLRLQRGYLAVSEEGHASPAAAADYQRCLELTASDLMGDEMFNTVIVRWTYHLIRGELAQCREISEFTVRGLAARPWYGRFNIAAFGILDCWEGDFGIARDLLELFDARRVPADEERFLAEWFNPNEPVTVILTCVGLVRFVMGDVAGADRAFVDARERAASMSFPEGPYSAAYALSVEAWMRVEQGRLDQADELVARMHAIAAQHGFDGWTMVGATQQAVLAGLRALGDGAGADALAAHTSALAAMTELWKAVDTRFFLPYYLMAAGDLSAGAGDRAAARAFLEDSLAVADGTGMQFWRAETVRRLASLEPAPRRREDGYRQALEVARAQDAHLFGLRAALDLTELDRRHVGELARALDRLGSRSPYPEVARAAALLGPRA